MLFNSFEFIFVFLPLTLVCVWLAKKYGPPRAPIYVALLASLAFYSWWRWQDTAILLGSIATNFCFGFAMSRSVRYRRALLITALALNVGLLIAVKYLAFIVGNINALLSVDLQVPEIPFPLGVSFFTFTQIAFLVDCYLQHVRRFHLGQYALFVTYFPHLIAGPILHHKDMISQFDGPRAFRPSAVNLLAGFMLFTFGLAKKVLLADSVAVPATAMFSAASRGIELSFVDAWIGTLAYAMQLYLDFSAYCDMAIALSFMLAIRMPINFNSPYQSSSIIEFWQRWHITLSSFLRDYIYIPLGGNRNGAARQLINVVLVMLIGGAWHGAGWTFIVWGGLHGLYLAANHLYRRARGPSAGPARGLELVVYRLLMLAAVLIAWVPFRADSLATTLRIWEAMLAPSIWWAVPREVASLLPGLGLPLSLVYPTALDFLVACITSFGLLLVAMQLPNLGILFRRFNMAFLKIPQSAVANSTIAVDLRPVWFMITGALMFVALRQMAQSNASEFLYFNF